MRMIRDKTGRFRERPFYDNEELDVECERIASDFLRRTHGDIRWPITTDDLTKLVEENVDDLDLYADLAESGAKVEGVTNFFADRRPCVEISRELSANKRNANRLRTTLTHELGHVRFHGFLFQLPTKEFGDLFSTDVRVTNGANVADAHELPPDRSQQCRRETIIDAREVDWLEWQAGYACGAFLMPASVLRALVSAFAREHSLQDGLIDGTVNGDSLIDEVSTRFTVSGDAARTRLRKLKLLLPPHSADTLFS